MKIRTAIEDFLVEIEIRKYTIKTQRGYKTNLNVFLRYCEEDLQITDMDDLDMAVVKRFTQRMIQLGRKGTYINTLLKTAKSFIQYCYEEELGGWDTRKRGFKWNVICQGQIYPILKFLSHNTHIFIKIAKETVVCCLFCRIGYEQRKARNATGKSASLRVNFIVRVYLYDAQGQNMFSFRRAGVTFSSNKEENG